MLRNIVSGPFDVLAGENLVGKANRLVCPVDLGGRLAVVLPGADDVPQYLLLSAGRKGELVSIAAFEASKAYRVEVSADCKPGDELVLDPHADRAGMLMPIGDLPAPKNTEELNLVIVQARAEESADVKNGDVLPLVRPPRGAYNTRRPTQKKETKATP
jgi:hypothetical protein